MTVNQYSCRCVAEDELYHYGVLGMKWGVRRYQPYSSKPRSSGKTGTEIGDAKVKRVSNRQLRKKAKVIRANQRKRYAETDISKLSDAELNKLNQRIIAENTYKKNMEAESASFGKKTVDLMLNAAKSPVGKLVTATLATYLTVQGAKWITNHVAKSGEGDEKIGGMTTEEIAKLFVNFMKPKK